MAKWFLDEPYSLAALRLVDEHELLAPDLVLAEVAQVIWTRTSRGELTVEQGAAILPHLGAALLHRALEDGPSARHVVWVEDRIG